MALEGRVAGQERDIVGQSWEQGARYLRSSPDAGSRCFQMRSPREFCAASQGRLSILSSKEETGPTVAARGAGEMVVTVGMAGVRCCMAIRAEGLLKRVSGAILLGV
jgi:hypothetical protein